MKSNEKQMKYASILEIIDGMKQDVVQTSMQQLMLTGVMPESSQNELKVLSQITGAIFNGMITIGTEVYSDESNDGLVYTVIGDKKYSCARINISNSVSISSKPLSASEAYSMTSSTVETQAPTVEPAKKVSLEEFNDVPAEGQKEQKKKEEEKEKEDKVEEFPAQEEVELASTEPEETNSPFQFGKLDEAAEFGDTEEEEDDAPSMEIEGTPAVFTRTEVEEQEEEEEQKEEEEPVSLEAEESLDDLLSDDDFDTPSTPIAPAPVSYDPDLENDEDFEEDTAPVREEPKAVEAPVAVQTIRRGDMFEEEQQKSINTMLFNISKLTLSHIDGGKPEEIVVMMAPLKVSRVAAPAVPIIVTLYNRGKVVTKTSFDMGDQGKAIVTIDINEFYLLCRGSFDDEGHFKAFIITTGLSSQQGDRLSVVSSKNYGNSLDENVKNGHIKMRYEAEAGPGTIEVFPFGTEKDGEFVVMVKNTEFCDTYYINQKGRTGSSVLIYGKDSSGDIGRLEIVPTWNGDILEVEVFEK